MTRVLLAILALAAPARAEDLEALTLACLRAGDHAAALGHAERWDATKPGDGYILGLKERALDGLGREREALAANRAAVAASPCDEAARNRLERRARDLGDDLRLDGRLSRWAGPEGLETPSPQRIAYENRHAALGARADLDSAGRVSALAGGEVRRDSQRNETAGLTYFDALETTAWLGLAGRPAPGARWSAEYGQSALQDARGSAVGRMPFSRARLAGRARAGAWEGRLRLERAPRYLRGVGASGLFAVLRRASADAEAEGPALGLSWLLRAGISDHSEGTTWKTWSAVATREQGAHLIQPSYFHGLTEYFGGAPDGRLRFVMTDRLGARWRHERGERWRLDARYGYSWHRDGNRLHDFAAEASGWLPLEFGSCRARPFYASYRHEQDDFLVPVDGYRSNDRHFHTLGAYWRQSWGRGAWTKAGFEKGFARDLRGPYELRAVVLEAEAWRAASLSLVADARFGDSTLNDQFHAAGFKARWSFGGVNVVESPR